MPSRRGLPPVVIWRGVSPSHAAMSRPRPKARALPTAAARAVALIVPIPRIVISRCTASSSRAIRTNPAFERAEDSEDEEERRRLLTFVIVGGGPTGVELAGALAELAKAALARDFRRIDPTTARIVLVEAWPRLLQSFPS